MLDLTTPAQLTDRAATTRVDAPVDAMVLRVEPVIPDEDWDKGLLVDVSATIERDGKPITEHARLDLSYRTHPSASWTFEKPFDGVKIEAEAIPVGAQQKLGVRLTAGTPDMMPIKRERPRQVVPGDH